MPKINHKDWEDIQKHAYVKGRIVDIDLSADTCSISGGDFADKKNVPLFYHCSENAVERSNGALEGAARAFAKDDMVIVLCRIEDSVYVPRCVIGFLDGIKPCGFYIKVLINGKDALGEPLIEIRNEFTGTPQETVQDGRQSKVAAKGIAGPFYIIRGHPHAYLHWQSTNPRLYSGLTYFTFFKDNTTGERLPQYYCPFGNVPHGHTTNEQLRFVPEGSDILSCPRVEYKKSNISLDQMIKTKFDSGKGTIVTGYIIDFTNLYTMKLTVQTKTWLDFGNSRNLTVLAGSTHSYYTDNFMRCAVPHITWDIIAEQVTKSMRPPTEGIIHRPWGSDYGIYGNWWDCYWGDYYKVISWSERCGQHNMNSQRQALIFTDSDGNNIVHESFSVDQFLLCDWTGINKITGEIFCEGKNVIVEYASYNISLTATVGGGVYLNAEIK